MLFNLDTTKIHIINQSKDKPSDKTFTKVDLLYLLY